jgi:hypothetical protein
MRLLQARFVLVLVFMFNAVHLAVHGTFLDGGALDSTVEAINVWAMNGFPADA